MILNARDIEKSTVIQCDICIIGAGAAGITLAREFNGSELNVWLLESGGDELEEDTQNLYKGTSSGRSYHPLDRTRLRYLGGTTNHWTGMCRPLDPIDFTKRSWIEHSGWPINYNELLPWYRRAQLVCELGEFNYDADRWLEDAGHFFSTDFKSFHSQVYQYSRPTRFGIAYREALADSLNITACLHANVTHLQAYDVPNSLETVQVKTLEGKEFRIKAKKFILACGGIENARILLASNDIERAGLGNQHDLVGRFFMDHLVWLPGGNLISTERKIPLSVYYGSYVKGRMRPRPAFLLNEASQKARQVANYNAMLFPVPRSTGEASYRYVQQQMTEDKEIKNMWQHITSMLGDFEDVAPRVYEDYISNDPSALQLYLYHQWEQVPNPASRITLTAERDRLGMQRVNLDWQLSKMDRNTLLAAQHEFALEMGRTGLGRVRLEPISDHELPEEVHGDNHQMGTTRMHDDPVHGVVDADCKVHGVDNLYVAGGAVFPTCGCTNPTLTVVALALRLADHLRSGLT